MLPFEENDRRKLGLLKGGLAEMISTAVGVLKFTTSLTKVMNSFVQLRARKIGRLLKQ